MTEKYAPLLRVELDGAALTDTQKLYILNSVPVRYGPGYEQEWGAMTGKVQITTDDYELDFEKNFFKPYGKPINKARCLKWWNNMSSVKRSLACARRPAYDRYLGRNQWMTKADPETYLKKEYYMNDYDSMI